MMTLADRLALLPDYARAEDIGLHVWTAERAVETGCAVYAVCCALRAFGLDNDDAAVLLDVATDAIRWS